MAFLASSGRHTPFGAAGPFHSPSSHSASDQLNSGAIWLFTNAASECEDESPVLSAGGFVAYPGYDGDLCVAGTVEVTTVATASEERTGATKDQSPRLEGSRRGR